MQEAKNIFEITETTKTFRNVFYVSSYFFEKNYLKMIFVLNSVVMNNDKLYVHGVDEI